MQLQSMNECYQKHNKEYDWFIIYDLDEFIFLKNINNIKLYLNRKYFNKCQVIQLNWVIHSDNNYIYYTNMSLKKRFPHITQSLDYSIDIKSIIRGKIKANITSQHYASPNLVSCNGFGKIIKNIYLNSNKDYNYYYIDHYYFKSTEEFVDKIMRSNASNGKKNRFEIIPYYFRKNQITFEKINYIENKTGINLGKYRQIIKTI